MVSHLSGTTKTQRDQFAAMPAEEQRAAVRRLAFYGRSDHAIAELVGWHVDEVRRAIAEHGEVLP